MLLRIRLREAPCPVCDARIPVTAPARHTDGAIATASCPACGAQLVPVRVATLLGRTGALLVDLAVLSLTALPLHYLVSWLAPSRQVVEQRTGYDAWFHFLSTPLTELLWGIAPLLAFSALYFLFFWGMSGRTLGQQVLGLAVVDASGRPPGMLRATIRVLIAFVGALPAGLGSLASAFDFERRTLQDHFAGTWVIRLPRTRPAAPTGRPQAAGASPASDAAGSPPLSSLP